MSLKKLKFIVIAFILSILIVTGSAFYFKIHQIQTSFDTASTANVHTSQAIAKQKSFTVLLLGVDTGAEGRMDRGNSDTMILASVNPQTQQTLLYSIPRDTMAQMRGMSPKNVQKINAAYNIGGAKMAKATVADLVNVPIDYYATINMGGLEKLVDAVGGVTVQVPFSWQDAATGNQKFKKGPAHLNGDQALAYVRMRHEDPNDDYGRQQRQQQLIKALAKKLLTVNGLQHYQKIATYLKANLKTDLVFDDMTTFVLKDHANFKDIKTYQLKGRDAWINGSAYQIASTTQLQKASDRLRRNLALPSQTLNNTETKLNAKNTTYDGQTDLNYQTFGLARQYYTNDTY